MREVPYGAMCGNCRWFADAFEHDSRVNGECQFHPPVVVQIGLDYSEVRPRVDSRESCSKWESDQP